MGDSQMLSLHFTLARATVVPEGIRIELAAAEAFRFLKLKGVMIFHTTTYYHNQWSMVSYPQRRIELGSLNRISCAVGDPC